MRTSEPPTPLTPSPATAHYGGYDGRVSPGGYGYGNQHHGYGGQYNGEHHGYGHQYNGEVISVEFIRHPPGWRPPTGPPMHPENRI